MNDPVIRGHNDETDYYVSPTGTDKDGKPYSLAPVCFIARCATWGLQDYLTPGEARILGAALIACADQVIADEMDAAMEAVT